MCWTSKTKTSFGLKINYNKVPGIPGRETHERVLTLLVEECAKKYDEATVRKALSSVTVEWWNVIAPRPSTGELNTVVVYNDSIYSGLTIGTLCKVAWRGKFWRSAFCHELLHVIGYALFGVDDPDHLDDRLWKELDTSANLRLSGEQL